MAKKDLPVYELRINESDDSVVDAIALVEEPAIQRNWIAFNESKQRFAANDEMMELVGPAMIPDEKIYRRDEDGYEYHVVFSPEQIRKIAQVFMKRGFAKNMNMHHTSVPADSYIYQSFLVDKKKGIKPPKGYEDVPDNTWFVGVKVDSDEVWKSVKSGAVKGFSIEGIFKSLQIKFSDDRDKQLKQLHQLLSQLIN